MLEPLVDLVGGGHEAGASRRRSPRKLKLELGGGARERPAPMRRSARASGVGSPGKTRAAARGPISTDSSSTGQVLDEPEYSADEPNHDECEGNLDEQADQEHRDERGRGLRRRPAARRFDERVCGEAEHRDETKQPERPARPSRPVLPERDSGRDCGREGEAERQ